MFAGFINTLAGNGSAITLSILTELIGLPGNIANGTNRVGIMAQGISSSIRFYQNKKLNKSVKFYYILLIFIGAVLGIYTATQVSNEQFKEVFKFLIIVMLFVIIIKPKRWIKESDLNYKIHPLLAIVLLIPLGFYGGFIQMGMGVFLLIVLVLIGRLNIMDANIIKVLAVSLYTIIAIGIFAYKGMIDWKIGGIIAIGQFTGGWLGAEFGSKWKHADRFSYWLLVCIVSFVSIRLLYQSFAPA